MQTIINCTPIVDEAQWHALRAPNVGCSEVAALLGIHPYQTGYGLAARKLGKLPEHFRHRGDEARPALGTRRDAAARGGPSRLEANTGERLLQRRPPALRLHPD